MFSKENQKIINKEIINNKLVNKSPYSDSYYTEGLISWDCKPEGSLRLSDHWNFYSQGEIHCKTNDGIKKGWYLGIYHNGTYTLIKKIFTPEQEAREERCKKAFFKKGRDLAVKAAKEKAKLQKALEKGGTFKVKYTVSEKHGSHFTSKEFVEECFCKGTWAFTSNGRKRVFEIVKEGK